MAKVNRTPVLYTKGRYVLITPFVADSGKVYTCIALRDYSDILEEGIDMVAGYYTPVGLTSTEYEEDLDLTAVMVTLVSADGTETIDVPSTYIESYPDMGDFTYQYRVISVAMLIPDTVDLEDIKSDIADVCTEIVGVTPTVEENVLDYEGTMSDEEHEEFEAARAAAINSRVSLTEQLATLQAKYDNVLATNAQLVAILVANGWVATT